MATVTVPAGGSQVVLDTGSSSSVYVKNTGFELALVDGNRLRPGQDGTFYPEGSSLVATSRVGTTLSVLATGQIVSQPQVVDGGVVT